MAQPLNVTLVGAGFTPSLALHNLSAYIRSDENLCDRVQVSICDYVNSEFQHNPFESGSHFKLHSSLDNSLIDILRTEPRVVGFSAYVWNINTLTRLVHRLKKAAPDVFTVFGGPDVSNRMHDLLARHRDIDAVIGGDGEIPFNALLWELLDETPDLSRVPNLTYREGDRVHTSTRVAEPLDLSHLRGIYDHADFQRTDWTWGCLLYETQRGCRYRCSYCTYGNRPVAQKETEVAVAELADLLGYGCDVEVLDPTFTADTRRAKQILGELSAYEYSGSLYLETRAELLDSEMVDLMVAARVSQVGIGLQTVSRKGLRSVVRGFGPQAFERGIALLTDAGISYYVDLILGLPETDAEDLLDTFDYLNQLGVCTIMLYRLLGLPGAPMLADAEKLGLVFSDKPPYELIRSRTFTPEDIRFCSDYYSVHQDLIDELGPEEFCRIARETPPSRFIPQLVEQKRNGAQPIDLVKVLEALKSDAVAP